MNETVLTVIEEGRTLRFRFGDLLLFHGGGFPGGVAHAFKVMELCLPLLSPDQPPERREIAIRTAFRGPGGRDAFEMVTRCVSGGRYTIDETLEMPERGTILFRYVFEMSYRGRSVAVRIREGHVRDEFILLVQKQGRTDEEERRLTWLKEEMAERLLALPAAEVYEVFA